MRRTGMTRRRALTTTGALALGAVLTGCSNSTDSTSATAHTAAVRAGRTLRAGAARTSSSLLDLYDRTVAAHPALAAGLAPLRASVREHAKVLSAGGGPAEPVSRPGTAKSTATAPATAPVPATDAKAALRELAAQERRAADSHTRSLQNADPELARLLASIAAAGAVHAYLLAELAKETSS